MGTAAVFAVQADKSGSYFKTIIGMTSDGFPRNLDYIATTFKETATRLRVLTKVKKYDWESIKEVFNEIIKTHDDWLFLDDVRRAQWVSHSVIYDPRKDTIYHHYGVP